MRIGPGTDLEPEEALVGWRKREMVKWKTLDVEVGLDLCSNPRFPPLQFWSHNRYGERGSPFLFSVAFLKNESISHVPPQVNSERRGNHLVMRADVPVTWGRYSTGTDHF